MAIVSKKSEGDERIVATAQKEADKNEFSLRPKVMSEYIGQTEVKKNLSVFMES
ncbi:MAG: hypothetical protein ACD_65C00171G0003, partial [uncultured bacterium]